ncbi:glycosyltransferase family 4 protein [Leptolyngbya sp. 15MV]|nr:glycosyltransferase family 4 protein [Leptolyngbya sp. 15MV]
MRILVVTPFEDPSWTWLSRHAALGAHEWSFHFWPGGLFRLPGQVWPFKALSVVPAARRADLVISHQPYMTLAVSLALRAARVRTPHYAFSYNLNERSFFRGAMARLARMEMPRLGFVQTFSTHEREIHHARSGIPLERMAFHHWAVQPPTRAEPHPEWSRAGPYALCMGRHNRDFVTFLRAMEGLDLRGVVICPRGLGEAERAPRNVTVLHDQAPEVCDAIQASAACTVVTLKDAATGAGHITLASSMHLGVPVVCTDVVTVGDYVIDGHNALLAPPKDAEALRRAIGRAAGDAALREGLTERAASFAQRWLTEAAAVRSLASVLEAFERGETPPLEPPGWSAWRASIGSATR